MKTLNNKVALVTGGSRGIGAAIVRRLAGEGANVAFTYVTGKDEAEALVKELEATGQRVVALQANSAEANAVTGAVEATVAQLGKLDILVNNAGIGTFKPFGEITIDEYDRLMDINVRGLFVATQAALKHMVSGSRIINIGSTNATRMPFEGGTLYAASKAAVQGLTMALSRDLGPLGITINNLQPGPVHTDLNPKDGPFAAMLIPQIAVGRYGTADEVASLVAFIAGPESAYITGAAINIDGGFKG